MVDDEFVRGAVKALSAMRPKGVFTTAEFAEYDGVSSKTALKTLTAWKKEGYVVCVGRIKIISPLTGFVTGSVGYRFKKPSPRKKKKKSCRPKSR